MSKTAGKKMMIRSLGLLMVLTVFWLCAAPKTSAAMLPKVKNVKVTASGKSAHQVKWKKISGVTGYQVYCRDCSSTSNLYKKVKTVKGASKVSCKITGRKAGRAYAYVVRGYKKSGTKVTYGKLSSIAYGFIKKTAVSSSSAKKTTAAASGDKSDIIQNPTTKQKYQKVFGDASLSMRYPGGYYSSASKASKDMKSIKVKTWDFRNGKSGEKYTRTWTIKVHKNLATTVQKIFNEIYNNSEKFPIHELGGYDWRGGHSEHNTGTAIDINWTENYMVNMATGVISAGSFWRPGKDPYSIPKNGVVAKIFNKYGFSQGDWGNSKDYMHFSYFGT